VEFSRLVRHGLLSQQGLLNRTQVEQGALVVLVPEARAHDLRVEADPQLETLELAERRDGVWTVGGSFVFGLRAVCRLTAVSTEPTAPARRTGQPSPRKQPRRATSVLRIRSSTVTVERSAG
jgi:hypothetical protein